MLFGLIKTKKELEREQKLKKINDKIKKLHEESPTFKFYKQWNERIVIRLKNRNSRTLSYNFKTKEINPSFVKYYPFIENINEKPCIVMMPYVSYWEGYKEYSFENLEEAKNYLSRCEFPEDPWDYNDFKEIYSIN